MIEVVPTAEGFRVDGRAPGDEAVTVTYDGDAMAVPEPAGSVVAERV